MQTTMDDVGVTFVNAVTNRGIFDNVININFATFLFTPSQERTVDNGKKIVDIEPELVMSLRLRMGEQCLRQLHQATTSLLELIDNHRAGQNNPPNAAEAEAGSGAKPN
jgi:hypothetical protein